MAIFVHAVCQFPGDVAGQVGLLWLADAALTAVCLAFSSLAQSSAQASLVSIYFVGFQLPLSGAGAADAAVHRGVLELGWRDADDARHAVLRPDPKITKTELAALPMCY